MLSSLLHHHLPSHGLRESLVGSEKTMPRRLRVPFGQVFSFENSAHGVNFLLLLKLFFDVDDVGEPLGQELFSHSRLPGELFRREPAAYQVAERLSYLLHGWQMVLADKVRRGDDAYFEGGHQIRHDGNWKIRANQPGLLQLGNVGLGMAHQLIEGLLVKSVHQSLEEVWLAFDHGRDERIGEDDKQAMRPQAMR